MGAIDIGSGAIDRANIYGSGNTSIDEGNPANDTGTLNSLEVWFQANGSGVKMGTFYGSGNDYTSRDFETIGNVSSGSKQTFSGLDCDVETGDLLGIYFSGGYLERDFSGSNGYFYKSGDQFGAGLQTYSESASYDISVYGTGETPSAGWVNIAKVKGIASDSITKINGISVTNIAKINGVAV